MRDLLHLACGECKRQNYTTRRNRKNTKQKLERSKFCPFCRKHTLHKEEKVSSG